MRKMSKMMGIAGIALAIGLVLAGCPTASSPGGGDATTASGPGGGDVASAVYSGFDAAGNQYTLTINKDPGRAAYSPKAGDAYVLVIVIPGGMLESTGAVQGFTGGVFTLVNTGNRAVEFTVIVSDTGIASIPDSIPLDTGGIHDQLGAMNPGTGSEAITTSSRAYTGTITGYTGNGTMYARYYGDTAIGWVNNIGTVLGGAFSFNLKDIPIVASELYPASTMVDFSSRVGQITALDNKVTLSNQDAKIFYASVYIVKPGENVGYALDYGNGIGAVIGVGDTIFSTYVYADRSVTINGSLSYIETYNFGGGFGGSDTYSKTYNLTLAQGWNIMYTSYTDEGSSPNANINTYNYSSTPFGGCAYLLDDSGIDEISYSLSGGTLTFGNWDLESGTEPFPIGKWNKRGSTPTDGASIQFTVGNMYTQKGWSTYNGTLEKYTITGGYDVDVVPGTIRQDVRTSYWH